MPDNVALDHYHIAAQCQTFASATTGTGVAIDARGWKRATFFLGFGTTTGTSATVDLKIQSDDNSGFSSASDITSGALTQIASVESADNTLYVFEVDLTRVSERYIRSHITTAGTVTSVPVYVHCVLSDGPIKMLRSNYSGSGDNY